LIFVLAAGPTIFLLKMGTNSLGIMFQNFIRMNTWTDPLTDSGFVEDWTVFYWAWWIAVGPFMGIFLAEISRGRTIRQVILGSLFFGSFGCAIYYIILGNYALHLELNDIVSVTGTLAEKGAPAAIITVIASLPLGKVVLALFCIVSVIFMSTTYNSSSYALASCASSKIKSGQSPARWHRLFWAFALAVLPLTLMFVGDLRSGGFKSSALESLKTASLVVSLPLLVVFVIMAFSLAKSLRESDRENTHQTEPED
jgi:BCCT family betaine/carnitine transporter